MEFEKSMYEFTIIRNDYGEFKVNTITRYINYLNKADELTTIVQDIKKDKTVIDVSYQEIKTIKNDHNSIENHPETQDMNLTEDEIDYGMKAIRNKRNKNKSIQISSNEMEFDEVFDIARQLNRYAETEDLGVTIIAVSPK